MNTFEDYTNEVITIFSNRFNATGSDTIHFPLPSVFPNMAFETEEETDKNDIAHEDD